MAYKYKETDNYTMKLTGRKTDMQKPREISAINKTGTICSYQKMPYTDKTIEIEYVAKNKKNPLCFENLSVMAFIIELQVKAGYTPD